MQLVELPAVAGKDVEEIRLLDNDTRTAYVEQDHWFPYTRATFLLAKITKLMKMQKGCRMPCLAIVGQSNCGKSRLLQEFVLRNAGSIRPLRETAIVPALYVISPPQADRSELYDAILDALNAPFNPNQKPGPKLKIVLHLLRQLKVRILVVDEINQAVPSNKKQMEIFLSAFRHLSNVLEIPVVLGGTQVLGTIIKNDPNLASRFKVEFLKTWKLDNAFLKLLKTLSERSILRKPVDLAVPELTPLIYGLTEGYLGDVVWLIRDATVKAIETGEETITPTLLRSLEWTAPSARKRSLETLP